MTTPSPAGAPVPVTLFTGYLGAGKTTLLNRLLHDADSAGIVVIVNEFGEVGLDHLLIEQAEDNVVLLESGCLCCTIRGSLVETIQDLWLREEAGTLAPISRFVIETSGLADPAPILQMLIAHPLMQARLRLDGVVCLVDAINGTHTLKHHSESARQVALADRLILSKTDLLGDASDLAPLTSILRQLNPGAPLVLTSDPEVLTHLTNLGLYDSSRGAANLPRWLHQAEDHPQPDAHHHHPHDHDHHDHSHTHGVESFVLRHPDPIPAAVFDGFLDLLRSTKGPNLLRLKGVVCLTEHPDRPVVVHGVQQVLHPPVKLPDWPTADRSSRLVFITHDCPKAVVERLFGAFVGQVQPDTADADAMLDNPLAISGFKPDQS